MLSKYLNRINKNLQVPVYALMANSGVIFIIGCVYLASSTAFNALIGTGLVLQQASFCFPAALLLYRRRSSTYLPSTRVFNLGVFGWVSNAATLIFGVVTLIFYNFPAEMPVGGGNMSMYPTTLITSYELHADRPARLHIRCHRCHDPFLARQLAATCE